MAGTIPLSMTQQLDLYGKPLIGGQLYIIQVGTVSTPQDAFVDTALTIKLPYPIPLDAAGRVPQFFLADGSVKIRLQDRTGVVQLASDSVLVIGPSAGGGGGSTVDPTQLIQTGNMIFRHGFGSIAGYVRLNGLTIGSSTSGYTEPVSASPQALYQYLWGIDPNLSVGNPPNNAIPGSGRGANALADWTANKQLSLPDWRGYALTALDDMGNVASGRMSNLGVAATTLGGVGGAQSVTLDETQIPAHKHSGITNDNDLQHDHDITRPTKTNSEAIVTVGASAFFWTGTQVLQTGANRQTHKHPFTTDIGTGGGLAHSNVQPSKFCTFYIKL